MRGVNLIPAHRRIQQQVSARKKFWFSAVFVYGTAVFAACMGTRVLLAPASATTTDELVATSARIGELNTRLAENRRALAEAEIARTTAKSISDQPDWSLLLALLGANVGDEMVLREIQLRPDLSAAGAAPAAGATPQAQPRQYILDLRGLSRSQGEVSQFVLRLQQVGLFDEVKLSRTGREPVLNSTAVSFEITCKMADLNGQALAVVGGRP